MKLSELGPLMARRRDSGLSFGRFRADPEPASLEWPDDVLEQFLFDHGDNAHFVYDYGNIDLRDLARTRLAYSAALESGPVPPPGSLVGRGRPAAGGGRAAWRWRRRARAARGRWCRRCAAGSW